MAEISAASNEQAQGIDQVNKAVAEMDKVTQKNAANAEESASASQILANRANHVKELISKFKLKVNSGSIQSDEDLDLSSVPRVQVVDDLGNDW